MGANKFKEFIVKNYKYIIVGGLFLLICVVVFIGYLTGLFSGKKGSSSDDNALNDILQNVEVPTDAYEEDAYPNVNSICTSYMNAMSIGDSDTMASLSNSLSDERRAFYEAQAQYLSQYTDYHFYTKKGPEADSFLVIITYNLLMTGDANKIPAACSLYVCTDPAGTLYINNADLSSDDEAYILALASQEDFKKLLDDTQLEYSKLMKDNAELSQRVAQLRTQINTDVQAKLEIKKQEETEAAALAAAEEKAAQEAANATKVKATTEVNIRASASTEADSYGKATAGQEFTRYEAMDNGWSRIDYNGKEAYIKTEFLEEVASDTGASDNGGESNLTAGSKITVTENVRIRAGASTDSDILGQAQSGDTFTLVELTNGWCKINYEGKDAYIKADFVK